MYRTILVAVDCSDSGFNALRQALSLAKVEKGAIKVISVAPHQNFNRKTEKFGNNNHWFSWTNRNVTAVDG